MLIFNSIAAIYVAILTNKATTNIAADVVPAVLETGFPPTSIPGLLAALASGSAYALEAIPEISPNIIEVASVGYKEAYSGAFKIVFLASIPFGVCSMIAAFFFVNIDERLSHDVVRRLDTRGEPTDRKVEDKEAAIEL